MEGSHDALKQAKCEQIRENHRHHEDIQGSARYHHSEAVYGGNGKAMKGLLGSPSSSD